VTLEKAGYFCGILLGVAGVGGNVPHPRHNPEPVFPVIGQPVQFFSLLKGNYVVPLAMNKKDRLGYFRNYLNRAHLAEVSVKKETARQYYQYYYQYYRKDKPGR
jgi:hypothetical protein